MLLPNRNPYTCFNTQKAIWQNEMLLSSICLAVFICFLKAMSCWECTHQYEAFIASFCFYKRRVSIKIRYYSGCWKSTVHRISVYRILKKSILLLQYFLYIGLNSWVSNMSKSWLPSHIFTCYSDMFDSPHSFLSTLTLQGYINLLLIHTPTHCFVVHAVQ